MVDQGDTARLSDWVIDGHIPAERHAEIKAHPHYRTACHELSKRMLRAAAADLAFDGMAKDAGRYLSAGWAVYLHISGGLTLPRLKILCAQSGFLSPGRARAMLLYLQFLGYVRPSPAVMPDRIKRFVPTPALIEAWRMHLVEGLEAAALLEPAIAPLLARLDEPQVLDIFLKIQGEGFTTAAPLVDQSAPFFRVFLHRHGGMQLLHVLLQSAAADDVFPPAGRLPVSTAAMARQLRVSRPHISRLLRDAEREGLLTRPDDGAVALSASARLTINHILSTRLIGFIIIGAKTVLRMPPVETTPDYASAQASALPTAIARLGAP